MGAQQSAAKGVKLRRRSAAAGAVTADELNEAGVDLAKAVAQSAKIQELSRAQQGESGGAGASARLGAGSSASAPRKPMRAAAPTIDMPPWEVVASLSESDWVALRAWIEAGWRCRKCSHMRDDSHEHPKAVQMLSRCGIVVPKPGHGMPKPVSSGGAGTGASPAHSQQSARTAASTITSGPPTITYASASPDNQVGYLSDTPSPISSRTASPAHPKAGGGNNSGPMRRVPGSDTSHESPRFHADCGRGSPFGGSDAGGAGADAGGVVGVEACPHL